MDVHLLVALMVGALPGVVAGSLLAPRTPDGVLRYVLAALTVLAAVRLLV